jgi:hypothetical protein
VQVAENKVMVWHVAEQKSGVGVTQVFFCFQCLCRSVSPFLKIQAVELGENISQFSQ